MDNKEKFGVELELITSSFTKKMKDISNKVVEFGKKAKQNFNTGMNLDVSRTKQEIEDINKRIQEINKKAQINIKLNKDGTVTATKQDIVKLREEYPKLAGEVTRLSGTLKSNSSDLEAYSSRFGGLGQFVRDVTNKIVDFAGSSHRIKQVQKNIEDMAEGMKPEIFNGIRDGFKEVSGITLTDRDIKRLLKSSTELDTELKKVAKSKQDINGVSLTGFGGLVNKIKDAFGKKTSGLFGGLTSGANDFGSSVQGAFSRGIGSIKKFSIALLGIRSAWTFLRQQAKAYIEENEQLSGQMAVMSAGFRQMLAPAITFIINLLSLAMSYLSAFIKMLTGVDIIKKGMASVAKSAKGSAGSIGKSAKEMKGALAGFDEINNIAQDDSSGGGGGGAGGSIPTASFKDVEFPDLDKIGETLAKKLNEAMAKIDWGKIQDGARKIAKGIADNINGFCLTLDWSLLGKTIGEGINTGIYFAQTFVNTIKWRDIGDKMITGLNSLITTIDWSALGDTIGAGFAGIYEWISALIEGFDYEGLVNAVCDLIGGVDWGRVTEAIVRFLVDKFVILPIKLGSAIGKKIGEAVVSAEQYFKDKIKESGGNVVEGIFNGIVDALKGIGNWINEHVFKPIIEAFKNAFGIHSPSTVMMEQGKFIVEGLVNAIKQAPQKIKEIWEDLKTKTKEKMKQIRDSIEEKFKTIGTWFKTTFQTAWNNIKSVFSASTVGKFFGNIWTTIKSKFTNIGQKIGSAVGGAFRGAVNAVLRTLESVLNSPIRAINSMIGTINKLPGVNIGRLSTFSLPRLATGTNYVPADTLAMIHKGEAVVPKKFNEREYFGGGNEETNNLIQELINIVSDIDFNTYLDGKKISQNTIDYINRQNRIMGRSVI